MLVVCFQRDHHAVLIGIIDGFLHEVRGNAVVLHIWIDSQIDDVKPLLLMKLVRPAGV